MEENSLFDLQFLLEKVLELAKEKNDEKFLSYMQKYGPESKLEDFDFYKDYLSSFELDKELQEKGLKNDCDLPPEEGLLLLQFTAASFSSEYELNYLAEEDKLRLSFFVKNSAGSAITKALDHLFGFQVAMLFRIYLDEMLHIEQKLEEENAAVKMERYKKLALFEEKVDRCRKQLQGASLVSQLDDLLNS